MKCQKCGKDDFYVDYLKRDLLRYKTDKKILICANCRTIRTPVCPECGKRDKIVTAVYGGGVAEYLECERCNCVVKKIYDKSYIDRRVK